MTTSPDVSAPQAGGAAHHSRYGTQPRTAWDFRFVMWNFAVRDLKARYRSAALGWTWSLLVPLATVAIYSLVFSVFFRAVPPPLADGQSGIYAVWFFVGLTGWLFFAASVQRGMGSLIGAGSMMQKIYLPGYVPVVGTVGALVVQLLIELGIVLVMLAVLGNVGMAWLFLPVWLALYVPFVAGVTLIMAILNVFVRDLTLMIGVMIQMLFFLTPIIYPIDTVPESIGGIPVRALISASPIAQFVMMLREILYEDQWPEWTHVLYVAVWAVAVLGVATLLFRRWGRSLGERM